MAKERSFSLLPYTLVTLAAVALTWILHEFAHWLMGSLLGNTMHMTMNSTYPANGTYVGVNDHFWVDAAGPFMTIVQALFFYVLLRKNASLLLFPFLFACFYMRLLATGISFINLNDEARISSYLGWGTFTLPVLVSLLLLLPVYQVIKTRKISTYQVLITVLLVMVFSSVMILSDQWLKG